MNVFAYLAIFISPIIGFILYDNKFKCNGKESIIIYLAILILSNAASCFIIFYFKNYLYLYFTISFFVKYSLITIATSILFAILFIFIKDNVKIHFIKKDEKK